MKSSRKWRARPLAFIAALFVAFGLVSAGAAQAGPTSPPPGANAPQGEQQKAPFEPGSRDAKAMKPLGATKLVATEVSGKPSQALPASDFSVNAGNVAGVDFKAPLNYCSKGLTYTPVGNTTAAAKSIQVRLYNQGMYRELYTSVPAGSTSYPAFYGIEGVYYAYLYVWNGSSYVYDEYLTNNNTCRVVVTRITNTGGWVQLSIRNTGTAYASQVTSELAPYPAAGTYTGTKYHYPVAGGATLYQWFQVGTLPYAITSYTSGSWNAPVNFTGDH